MKTDNGMSRNYTLIFVIVISLLGAIAYANSIAGKFLWDDHDLIVNNLSIQHWSMAAHLFTESIGSGAGKTYAAYRPFQLLTYMIDHALWGSNSFGYHLTNVILHISAGLCIFWLITLMYKDGILAFITSALFVTHPVHTEAVSYISGRADPLALTLVLLAMIFYIRSIDARGAYNFFAMIICYAFSLLSRESSIMVPVAILFYHYAFNKRVAARSIVPLAGLACIYILIRCTVFRALFAQDITVLPLHERVLGFLSALSSYARLLILPTGLHMEYGMRPPALFGISALSGAALAGMAIVYCVSALARRRKDFFLFPVGWFFIMILPMSNMAYPINAYMAEHWLYMPSIGVFLMAAYVFRTAYSVGGAVRVIAACACVVMVSASTLLTIRQNVYWNEPIAFYSRLLRYSPESARAYNNLGIEYYKAGRYEEAIGLYEKALRIDPGYGEVSYNLGDAFRAMGRSSDAIGAYKKALEIDSHFINIYNNLGITYILTGQNEEAVRILSRGIVLDPGDPYLYNNIAIAYRNLGMMHEAIVNHNKALELKKGR